MHENRETSSPTARVSGSPAGEGESRTSGTHGSEESDLRCSTDEAVEQSNGPITRGSGDGGGKGANQGERPEGTRGSGTGRSSRVTGPEGRAESRKGEGAGTVHYAAAPSDRGPAAGQLSRAET